MRFYYIFVKNQPPISTLSREFTGLDHFARQKKNSRSRSFSSAAESPKMDKANLKIGGILYLQFRAGISAGYNSAGGFAKLWKCLVWKVLRV